MKILIAEDDADSREILRRMLIAWGHEVVAVNEGNAAWQILQQNEPPPLAILDWMMPGLDGPELCRRTAALERTEPTYLILLTAKHEKEDLVFGLTSGANDYLVKPFDRRELKSRIDVGQRTISLQQELAKKVAELEKALLHVKQLQRLLPICSYCKKIRNNKNNWQPLDTYLDERAGVKFSHGVCPTCYESVVRSELLEIETTRNSG